MDIMYKRPVPHISVDTAGSAAALQGYKYRTLYPAYWDSSYVHSGNCIQISKTSAAE